MNANLSPGQDPNAVAGFINAVAEIINSSPAPDPTGELANLVKLFIVQGERSGAIDPTLAADPLRIFRYEDLRILGFGSRYTIWRKVRTGKFPRPLNILDRPGWRKIDIERYLEELLKSAAA